MSYKLSKGDDEKIYVTLENGKTYCLEAVLHNRQYQSDMTDLRERYTRRAVWRRSHVFSIDDEGREDDEGNKKPKPEYGDGGRFIRQMLNDLDRPERLRRQVPKCVKAKRASSRIARALGLARTRNVERFVASVWENGNGQRLLTMAEFKLSEDGYYKRLRRYLAILGWGNGRC